MEKTDGIMSFTQERKEANHFGSVVFVASMTIEGCLLLESCLIMRKEKEKLETSVSFVSVGKTTKIGSEIQEEIYLRKLVCLVQDLMKFLILQSVQSGKQDL